MHTNISFLRRVLHHPEYIKGNVETGFLEKYKNEVLPHPTEDRNFIAIALYGVGSYLQQQRTGEASYELKTPLGKFDLFVNESSGEYSVRIEHDAEDVVFSGIKLQNININNDLTASARINNEVIPISLQTNGANGTLTMDGVPFIGELKEEKAQKGDVPVTAPMPGKVVKILASVGQSVEEGAPIAIIEAMKMECTINAACSGIVTSIPVNERDVITEDQPLAIITC